MIAPTYIKKPVSGFTLIELTVIMIVGIMVAMMTLALFTQQLNTFSILREQNFMMREAPQVTSLLNRLVSRSDTLLVDQANDKLTLTFIDPTDNSTTTAEIQFTGGNLVYKIPASNPASPPVSEWNISTQLKNINFDYVTGVLLITLTGPNDGEIQFATTPL